MVSSSLPASRSVSGICSAVNAITYASLASVFASPGSSWAALRIAEPGRWPTATPMSRATASGSRPVHKNGHDRNAGNAGNATLATQRRPPPSRPGSHAATLRAFLDWLLEAAPQRRLDCDARTFRRRSAWCWQLEPRIEPDGVVHRVVMADGIWVNGWCLLAAVDGQSGEVLARQWCDRGSTAAYRALFEQIAPPDVLVCDGMKGILKACAQTWPHTRVQRCLVHVQRDTRADLTSRPRLQAGREPKKLADTPARIHDTEAAVRWGEALNAWHERWKHMLAERTYAKDNPDDPRAATSKGGWWWTHLPLRRACE